MPSETSWTQEEETHTFSHMWTMDHMCVNQRWEEENLGKGEGVEIEYVCHESRGGDCG